MKKIITSILAFSLTAALFTGCGQTDNSDESSVSSVVEAGTTESESETAPETTASTADTGTTTAETTETSTADASVENAELSGDYEDVIRDFYEATNSNDYEALMKTTYPAKIVEGMLGLINRDPDGFNDEMGQSDSSYEITDILEVGPMTQEELDANVMFLNNIAGGLDILKEHGGDPESLSDEERKKVSDAIMGMGDPDGADIPDYYSSSKGFDVTVRYNKDGKADEDYFYVFYIDGEGWKVNNSMRKFVKKAKNASANAGAKNLYNAFNAALIDAEDGGMDLSGVYIIGSDESMNYNVPSSVNTAEVLKLAANYYDEIDDYDFFFIVNNGSCIYSASDKKDDEDVFGTYPVDQIPAALSTIDGSRIDTVEKVSMDTYTFEELFELAKKTVK